MGYLDTPAPAAADPITKPLLGRTICVGICGSVSAPKSLQLITGLQRSGATVLPVLTDEAGQFLGPWAVRSLVASGTYPSMFEVPDGAAGGEPHIEYARRADLMVVYPASGDLIASLRYGFSSSTVALVANQIVPREKLMVFPALSTELWKHEDRAAQVAELRGRGIAIVGPVDGRLASGAVGAGRLVEPADALQIICAHHGRLYGDLRGKKVVVSAGGSREAIDGVRYLTNRSTGRQGLAIAAAARDRGAQVVLISSSDRQSPLGMESIVRVENHAELATAVATHCADADVYIGVAAVADFTPVRPVQSEKLPRGDGRDLVLTLKPTTDIIASLTQKQLLRVAFAAEMTNPDERARDKLVRKGVQLVVMNDVSKDGQGFAAETNRVTIFGHNGLARRYPAQNVETATKYDVASAVLDEVVNLLAEKK